MKVLLFGNSGSGKSTLAHRMAAEHGLAHLDLDGIVWEPRKVAVQRPMAAVRADLQAFMTGQERWVIEGCYGELVRAALPFCTELWFLDPGEEKCILHCQQRPWETHKYGSAAEQDAMLPALLAWVRSYYHREDDWSYAVHHRIFEEFGGMKRKVG